MPCGVTPGISSIQRGPVRLTAPTTTPEFRYGLAFPFQVATRLAGVFCNIRFGGNDLSDTEFGCDAILFDDLSRISSRNAVPLLRHSKPVDPATGSRRFHNVAVIIGGFVPFGAKRRDGSPHPHAGTGFGIGHTMDHPLREDGFFSWDDPWRDLLEAQQFAFDGKQFKCTRAETRSPDSPLRIPDSPWTVFEPGMCNAIPDGDGFLFPILAQDGTVTAAGVSRWERLNGEWQPVSFTPAAPAAPYLFRDRVLPPELDVWAEPSLVRDVDGALLFHARGYGRQINTTVRLWRSTDGGRTWEMALNVEGIRRESPCVLSCAADGTPYFVGNFPRFGRDILCLWWLDSARRGLGGMAVVRDASDEFGEVPGAAQWYADRAAGAPPPARADRPNRPLRWWMDHPNAVTLQLADGAWHNILAYRFVSEGEIYRADPPSPYTGTYLDEVLSRGWPVPTWRF